MKSPMTSNTKPVYPYQQYLFTETETCFDLFMAIICLLSKHRAVKDQDIVTNIANLLLYLCFYSNEILSNILAGCRFGSGMLYDPRYRFHTHPWVEEFYIIPQGYWRAHDGSVQGYDAGSLARRILGAPDVGVLEHVAGFFGIKFSDENVRQANQCDRLFFIRHSHSYQSLSILSCQSILYRIFGPDPFVYWFYTQFDQKSFALIEWKTAGGFVHLFCTLQQDKVTGEASWFFLAPPPEFLGYNMHLIDKFEQAAVVIHDQIARASWQLADPSQEVHTWAGERSFAEMIDWSCLQGRPVSYVFYKDNPDSIRIGAMLIKKLGKLGVNLSLRCCDDLRGLCEVWSHQDFYDFARSVHGLDLEPKAKAAGSGALSLNEFIGAEDFTKWQAQPLWEAGRFILLAAFAKVGKTLVATDLTLMLALGGLMGSRLRATKAEDVLYVDTELPGSKFVQRVKELLPNYSTEELPSNFKLLSMVDLGKHLDLSKPEDQEWFLAEISSQKPMFIVIDNLGGIMPYGSERCDAIWERVSRFIKSITATGITVLVVHHINKAGSHRGSGKINDDVDLSLQLSRPDDCPDEQTLADFRITHARYLSGEQRTPFRLEYRSENGQIRRTLMTVDDESPVEMVSRVSPEEISGHGLPSLQIDILNAVRDQHTEFVKARLFVTDAKGRSATTVTDHLKDLCEKGLLVKAGEGSATKYYDPKRAPHSDSEDEE